LKNKASGLWTDEAEDLESVGMQLASPHIIAIIGGPAAGPRPPMKGLANANRDCRGSVLPAKRRLAGSGLGREKAN